MPKKSQIRFSAISGSFPSGTGEAQATIASLSESDHGSLADTLNYLANSVQRIHGASDWTNQAAGTFSQSIVPGTDGAHNIGQKASITGTGSSMNFGSGIEIKADQSIDMAATGNKAILIGGSSITMGTASAVGDATLTTSSVDSSSTTLQLDTTSTGFSIGDIIKVSKNSDFLLFVVLADSSAGSSQSLSIQNLSHITGQASSAISSPDTLETIASASSGGYGGSSLSSGLIIKASAGSSNFAVFTLKHNVASGAVALVVDPDQERSTVATYASNTHSTVESGFTSVAPLYWKEAYLSHLDMNGSTTGIILDADGDTSIAADTDDQIDFAVGGSDVMTLTDGSLVIKGTTPKITIGDAGEEDTSIVFDGNAVDMYMGLDDSADKLLFGLGSAVGTTPNLELNSGDRDAKFYGNLEVATDLTVSGGDVKFGNGQNATIDVNDVSGTDTAGKSLTILAGAGTGTGAGGDIIFQTANAGGSTGTSVNSHATALTLSDDLSALFAGNVTVTGDLTVSGDTTTLDVANLLVEDPVILMAKGTSSANSNGGIVIHSGSSASSTPDMVFGRIANDTWGAGIMNTQAATETDLSGMTLTKFNASEVLVSSTSGNKLSVSTDLVMDASADIQLHPAGNHVIGGSDGDDHLGRPDGVGEGSENSSLGSSSLASGQSISMSATGNQVILIGASTISMATGTNISSNVSSFPSSVSPSDTSISLEMNAGTDFSIGDIIRIAGSSDHLLFVVTSDYTGGVNTSLSVSQLSHVSGQASSLISSPDNLQTVSGADSGGYGGSSISADSYIKYTGSSGASAVFQVKHAVGSGAVALVVDPDEERSASATWDLSTFTGAPQVGGTAFSRLAWGTVFADNVDFNGEGSLILDADGDSSIRASSDDVVSFKIGGTDVMAMKSTGLHIIDDLAVYFGSGDDARIEYDEDGTDQLRIHQPAGGVVLAGTNPKLVIGDAGEEDTMLVFDGAAMDARLGIDDSADTLELGIGTAHGTTALLQGNSSGHVTQIGDSVHTERFFLQWNGSKAVFASVAPTLYRKVLASSDISTSSQEYTFLDGDSTEGSSSVDFKAATDLRNVQVYLNGQLQYLASSGGDAELCPLESTSAVNHSNVSNSSALDSSTETLQFGSGSGGVGRAFAVGEVLQLTSSGGTIAFTVTAAAGSSATELSVSHNSSDSSVSSMAVADITSTVKVRANNKIKFAASGDLAIDDILQVLVYA